jgi:hypothetical protein
MRAAHPARLTFAIQRMRGGEDFWVTEGIIAYDGTPMRTVTIMEFRGGKVAHETIYFGEPWEPPAWRAQWVEAAEDAIGAEGGRRPNEAATAAAGRAPAQTGESVRLPQRP